jgi:transposase
LSRDGSSSSTRPGSRPTWRPCAAGGRADRGSRPACRTAIGRRSPSSPPCDAIASTWVIDGPINGELFTLYVEKVLGPTLAKGDVVILDNLGSHKGQAARRAIRAAGAHLLFLPPYSPDLNPIEQLFAKLKHLIRKAEPRTIEATWRKVGDLLNLFSPAECANYLKNAGYASV